jgi:hypothetical protein
MARQQIKLSLVLIAALAVTAFASQIEPTKEEIRQTLQHMQRLAKEQQAELDAANTNETNIAAREANIAAKLTSSQGFLSTATSSLIDVQKKIYVLAQHDANETAAKKHILHKYHILKGIAMAIAAGLAVFVVMRLTSFIPTFIAPYKIYLYAAAGGGAALLVATLL